jgi:hypothetical protein
MSQDAEMFLKAPGAVSRLTEQLSSFIYGRMLLRKNRDKKMTTTVRVIASVILRSHRFLD